MVDAEHNVFRVLVKYSETFQSCFLHGPLGEISIEILFSPHTLAALLETFSLHLDFPY
jgi:hypothetical protein